MLIITSTRKKIKHRETHNDEASLRPTKYFQCRAFGIDSRFIGADRICRLHDGLGVQISGAGRSKYFCRTPALRITTRDSIRDGPTLVAYFWLVSFARGYEMRDEHISYDVREGRSAPRSIIFVTAISLLLWSLILIGLLLII